jgi:Uma2 family endonuclease
LAKPHVRFKADDIWDAPDDGNRYEVIDGELYVTPAPGWSHQIALGNLYLAVGSYVRQHRLGYLVQAPTGVALDPESGVEPDIVYVSRERASIISERGVEGAPDLVVEALSPSTAARDRGIKMRRYAAAGIPYYWILDPRTRALEAYRLAAEGYEQVGSFQAGDVFRPELFPGLEIAIDDLWT